VLGVARDASDRDIKSAFRRLARELHPDVNPGDPTAEERFKEVADRKGELSAMDLEALMEDEMRVDHAHSLELREIAFSGESFRKIRP